MVLEKFLGFVDAVFEVESESAESAGGRDSQLLGVVGLLSKFEVGDDDEAGEGEVEDDGGDDENSEAALELGGDGRSLVDRLTLDRKSVV